MLRKLPIYLFQLNFFKTHFGAFVAFVNVLLFFCVPDTELRCVCLSAFLIVRQFQVKNSTGAKQTV